MISVLIVEDDKNKCNRIAKVINDADGHNINLSIVSNSSDAIRWCQNNPCDVLVLDLHIPRIEGDSPQKNGGQEVLRKILRADSKCSIPARAVGLTSYDDLRDEFRSYFEREGWVIAKYDQASRDWEETVSNAVLREISASLGRLRRGLLLALHGIRTTAEWHRTIADVAQAENWICPIERMWYGRFSVIQFLSPWSRSAKVRWFRNRYSEAVSNYEGRILPECLPSIVAHSFGTLILGNALLKFKDMRVDSVVLCGSILPRDFPWNSLIENGQVQRILHDVGTNDVWPRICSFIIPGTGSSGRDGFSVACPNMTQDYHNLSHNEFFDARQMRRHWFRFLNRDHTRMGPGGSKRIATRPGDHPWITPVASLVVLFTLLLLLSMCAYGVSKGYVLLIETAASGIFPPSNQSSSSSKGITD